MFIDYDTINKNLFLVSLQYNTIIYYYVLQNYKIINIFRIQEDNYKLI